MGELSSDIEPVPGKEEFQVTPIVYIVLIRDDKILLIKRGRGRYDGFWSLPAGHVDEGENARQTAAREAHEELGIDIEPSSLDFAHLLHVKDTDGQRMIVSLRPKTWEGEPANMEPHKHSEVRWFPLIALPDNMPPYTKGTIVDISSGVNFRESNWIES